MTALLPGAEEATAPVAGRTGSTLRAVVRQVATTVLVIGVVVLLWVVALRVWDVSPYVGKTPAEVWTTLFGDDDSAELRTEIWALLQQTLTDAAVGFAAGMLTAVVLAAVVVRSKALEGAVMPVALVLQTVPLIALAPILILLVGRGYGVVAIMSAIVVLFPALVNIVLGLRSVTPQMRDLVLVYGGSPSTVLLKVGFPSALPALFASVRIAVPGALTGALLAEWLATGKGIGYAVVSAANRSQNARVWALVVVVSLTALLLYLVAQLVETAVLGRFGRPGGAR
ncbi:ABC-type nitrate/sulfonate/bicarbonate transport system, permease component [Geodermatophilus amargosae]|uniref:ABC-type nitrate/sulfonate/bicarbonate transport system, permease component n=1 Tax=Geodermatophilus amargosae TaxID=1296565 RepID=A0A1I7BNY0_9ACTN|nr:ABC transporter permease subunit [Geodermatophilus amargosae]SFT88887.1 ABC-type nitrate/sulfonate/bicarbonate transport system, permease component [Geodermatophilus amargosae]